MKLTYSFSEEDFVAACADRIARNVGTISEDVFEALSLFLAHPTDDNGVLRSVTSKFTADLYDESLSLKDYIDAGWLTFYYLSIDIYYDKNVTLDIKEVAFPSFVKLNARVFGSGEARSFSVKLSSLKTKGKTSVKFYGLKIDKSTLLKISQKVASVSTDLIPSKLSTWEWRQTFYDKISGQCYLCECFRPAIQKSPGSSNDAHVERALNSNSFRHGVCHLCTGRNSDLVFCHTMYGSSFKVRYGAYINKVQIELDLDEREAENKIRELKGVAKIGEHWINETLLFNYISVLFPQHTIEREASPKWIGNQRLDIYILDLKLAVEYQGQQHFNPVKLFGGEEGLTRTQERDRIKAVKCKENGVELIYFTHKENLSEKLVNKKLKKYIERPYRQA